MSNVLDDSGPSTPSHTSLNGTSISHSDASARHSTNGEERHLDDRYSGSTRVTASQNDDTADEQGLTSRRERVRRSGGFILDSVFPPRRVSNRKADSRDAKGKRKEPQRHTENIAEKTAGAPQHAGHPHRNSPLSKELKVHGLLDGQDAENRSREAPGASPVRPDQGAVRNRDELDTEAFNRGESSGHSVSATSVIDPTQIVNMALNLSESRRRNFSGGQYVQPPLQSNRRIVSATPGAHSLSVSSSYYNQAAGGSLKQHLQQQRRILRNGSSGTGQSSAQAHEAARPALPYLLDPTASLEHGQTLDYKFSAGTLARAQKARKHIELFYEYRRLLQFLPPLRPNIHAPGNTFVSATSIPGTSNVHITRVPIYPNNNHELGRQYNVLQTIRNRKIRTRERRPLPLEPEAFEHVERVRTWVDAVTKQSCGAEYRQGDAVLLPSFSAHDSIMLASSAQADAATDQESFLKPPQAIKRPRMDYVFTPAELLADAYWMEQGDNKSLIENRSGNKIFPANKPPSSLQPRLSKEESREPEKKINSVAGSIVGAAASDPHTAEDSDEPSERGRKRRLFLGSRQGDDASLARKHGWHVSRARSRSSSGLSSSEDDGHAKRRKSRQVGSHDENIGPLALHLQDMVDKEATQGAEKSPVVESPDQWGVGHISLSGNLVSPEAASQERKDLSGDLRRRVARHGIDAPRHLKTQTQPTDHSIETRSSFEELSTEPNSPMMAKDITSFGLDFSPPPSRRHSLSRKTKKIKLPLRRSDASVRSHNTEGNESAVEDREAKGSRQSSGDAHLLNGTKSRSVAVRNILSHRRNESRGSVGGRPAGENRKDTSDLKDAKDPSSAVARFFKGGRLGEIVRTEGSKVGEFIFKRDPPTDGLASSGSSDDSNASDSEDEASLARLRKRPSDTSHSATVDTTGSISSRRGNKLQYHIDLPSFRPSHGPDPNDTTSSGLEDDPIHSRQLLPRGRGRTPRFKRLAPPRMDLSGISSKSPDNGDMSRELEYDSRRGSYGFDASSNRSPSASRRRLDHILQHPGAALLGSGPPPTGLTKNVSPSSHRSSSRPTLAGKRHWSISDQRRASQSGNEVIITWEIARTSALLLCSGIKAREIYRRAHIIRDEPPLFLQKAANAAQVTLIAVPRKEEHVLAARILTTDLENTTHLLREATDIFQNTTCSSLATRISALKLVLHDQLTPRVSTVADEADAFTRELTGTFPLKVKEVYDRVGLMMRRRRRRLRWVRRGGWALLEWMVLLVMWLVWLVVVVINAVKSVTIGVLKVIMWFFWL